MSGGAVGLWIGTGEFLCLQADLRWYGLKQRSQTVRQAFLINASYGPIWAALVSFTSGEGWGVFFVPMGSFLIVMPPPYDVRRCRERPFSSATWLGYMTLRQSPIAPEWDQRIYPPNPVPGLGPKWKRIIGAGLLLAIMLVMFIQTLNR